MENNILRELKFALTALTRNIETLILHEIKVIYYSIVMGTEHTNCMALCLELPVTDKIAGGGHYHLL